VVLAGSALEVVLREDRSWLAIALAPSVVIALSLLWRRTRPLAAVTVAFGTLIAFELARIVAIDVTGLNSIAAALVLSYALLRWGAGREAVLGLGAILVWLAVTHIADRTSFDEVIAGYGFFLFAAALGASVRFHANARLRDIEQAKLRLRNELARELHDTVGHHVSAIAIQAQAGRAMAAYDPIVRWRCSRPSRRPPPERCRRMHRRDGQLVLSASDVVNFAACGHLTAFDVAALDERLVRTQVEDPQLALIAAHGLRHEADHLAELETSGVEVARIDALVAEGATDAVASRRLGLPRRGRDVAPRCSRGARAPRRSR
jgi:hypothetical protein